MSLCMYCMIQIKVWVFPKYMNTSLECCRFNSLNCSWVATAATEKLECENHNIRAIVSQKMQNTHTFVAKITKSTHPNFVHFWGLLYISEKICTFHFLSQTGIGPLHCQSYARRSNMGKCHKLVLGLKFWSVYIFKSPLAATALSPFSILYLRKRDW